MLQETSERFRKFFLLEFTKQLIQNNSPGELFKLEKMIEDRKNQKREPIEKETLKQVVKEKERKIVKKELALEDLKFAKTNFERNLKALKRTRPILRIPEPRLPQTMSYLKPFPVKATEIDLGKLNPLIQDPMIKTIECKGPEENIIVRGALGTKPTKIVLNKEEIDEVIKKFSEATKIPAQDGVFKAVTGKLILSAIISEIVGSKFIIKKMSYHPGFSPERQQF